MAEHLLVVDDELSMRELLAILFERQGYRVSEAASAEAALEILARGDIDGVVTDMNMPGMDGLELVRLVRSGTLAGVDAGLPMVMVTAYGTTQTAIQAMKEGADDYVLKPFDNDELVIVVAKALGHRALEEENAALKSALQGGFQEIIGVSPAMQAVYARIRKVQDSRISCLIHGESGTGKELVARAIHQGSPRAAGPFVAVNCGAIPEGLIESELFGHRKGAFTGALRDRVGYFESANGGTLFLDEIGEMPLAAQVKLLRVLQERRVVAVGDTQAKDIDARILAATNRDLEAEIAEGRFREDLYYRLNVVRIDLPPLRERREDVVMLAEHFTKHYAREHTKPVTGLSSEVIEALRAYPWPGNVRELQNAIEGAVAMESGAQITTASLPRRLSGGAPVGPVESVGEIRVPEEGVDLAGVLENIERAYLQAALDTAQGNKTRAAKLLGMSFRSFRYRLAKLELGD
ncbi:MAG: sigma-54 dependent transcriptional regulator [Myxococcota bacterium]|nr:sigma-54 dependent transcriptional regulator [Myxococcota bacterium]